MTLPAIFFVGCGVFILIAAVILIRCRCLFKGLVFNAVTGVGTLLLLNLFGSHFGMVLPLSLCTAAIGFVLGLPGVLLITLLKIIWLV